MFFEEKFQAKMPNNMRKARLEHFSDLALQNVTGS